MIEALPTVEIRATIRERQQGDQYSWLRVVTEAHRKLHRCWAYPYADGTILGAISEALTPSRVLELGTALGYTTCWWASKGAMVDTIESDPIHVELARTHIAEAGLGDGVVVHEGDFAPVLADLNGFYDLVFFDGYEPTDGLIRAALRRVNDTGALLVTNLNLGDRKARMHLEALPDWQTTFFEDLALVTRRLSDRIGDAR